MAEAPHNAPPDPVLTDSGTADSGTTGPAPPHPGQRYAHRGNLVDGSITRHLFRMAAPMTWGIFAIISFQLIDLFFIGMLGTDALAAVSFTLPVSMTVFSLILGLSIGMSSVLSRLIGRAAQHPEIHDEIIRITTHGLVLGVLFGLLVIAVGLATVDPLFRAMGADDRMMPIIHDYIRIWFAGAVFLTLPLVGNAALRATGNAAFPAIVMTLAAVMNVILDPLLIFGLFGFPEMGVRGAALATVFANAGAMAACLLMLGGRLKMIRLRPFEGRLFGQSCRRLLVIGLPAGLTNIVQPVTNGIIITLLSGFGAEAVAAYGIVTRVEAFAFVVVMGLAGGMAPIIGQNWGAARYDRVNETLRQAFTFNVGWSFLVAAGLGFGAYAVAGLFSDNQAVIALAALYFWVVPITYAAGNLVPGWASAFNAMGTPERAALMILCKHVAIMLPAVFVGMHVAGVTGIFVAIAAANLCAGLGLHVYSRTLCRRWERAALA